MLVAPENFFARDCREGYVRQFDEGQKNTILERVAELSRQYPNILIIPGTVSWKKKAVPDDLGKLLKEEAGNHEALLYRTGIAPNEVARDGDEMWHSLSGQKELDHAVVSTKQHGHNRGYGMSKEEYDQKLEIFKRTYNDIIHNRIPAEREFHLAYNTAYLYLNGNCKHIIRNQIIMKTYVEMLIFCTLLQMALQFLEFLQTNEEITLI